MSITTRFKTAWSAFKSQETYSQNPWNIGAAYGVRPDRSRLTVSNDKSIITSIYTRLSIDISSITMRHVRLDDAGRYLEDMPSGLNECLTVEANIDQAATAFRHDIAMTLFDKGVAAIVPVVTNINPSLSAGFDIKELRVGEVVSWYPKHVKVKVYNEATGRREELTLPKRTLAIVENPLYAVMNEPNSTLQRLIRKLNMLDSADEQASSGKLDLIIQLPYVVKSEARRQQAELRRKDIEVQLKGSQYGIAYTDGTERITQLNRPTENNLQSRVEYLTDMLFNQLGLTKEVFDGTADEKTMLNYHNRTIAPVLDAITEAMRRNFITKTGRSQRQSVMYFRDPFKLVAVGDIAEIADKFTRNEILSSNEVRGILGLKPSAQKGADDLRNKNLPEEGSPVKPPPPEQKAPPEGDNQNGT